MKCNKGQPVCKFCTRHGFRCGYRVQGKSRLVFVWNMKAFKLRLKIANSEDQLLSVALERLAKVEEKLESRVCCGSCNGNKSDPQRAAPESDRISSNTPIKPPSLIPLPPPSDRAGVNILLESAAAADFHLQKSSPVTVIQYTSPRCNSEGVLVKERYLGKSPFTCEELRPALPDKLCHAEINKTDNFLPYLANFFEVICPLYPVICDLSVDKMVQLVQHQGFGDDIHSCLILLIVALSKAYLNEGANDDGLLDFQQASHVLVRLPVQISLEYVQAQILSALFFSKKGRLLSYWTYLYAGCTALYTLIKRCDSGFV